MTLLATYVDAMHETNDITTTTLYNNLTDTTTNIKWTYTTDFDDATWT